MEKRNFKVRICLFDSVDLVLIVFLFHFHDLGSIFFVFLFFTIFPFIFLLIFPMLISLSLSLSLSLLTSVVLGNFDTSKGSYYANPQYDRPIDDETIISQYPAFVHPNIWPTEDFPELELAFKELGRIIVSVGILVARQCDRFIASRCSSYPSHKLQHIIEKSLCCKARLLHYFPNAIDELESSASVDDFASWCGWHNDHGSLTGLTSAMFIDETGNIIQNNDNNAGKRVALPSVSSYLSCCFASLFSLVSPVNKGLYVRSRKSELIKVNIPSTHIGFQIGETAQVHSGGILQVSGHFFLYLLRLFRFLCFCLIALSCLRQLLMQ
jgi:hypothetical protein